MADDLLLVTTSDDASVMNTYAVIKLLATEGARPRMHTLVNLAPDAQVAAAVVRFDKTRPVLAFSRLGPLTRRFPHASTVRFHLGLLLLWLARAQPGAVAEADGPDLPVNPVEGVIVGCRNVDFDRITGEQVPQEARRLRPSAVGRAHIC